MGRQQKYNRTAFLIYFKFLISFIFNLLIIPGSIDTLMDIRLLQQEALFKANQLPRHQSYKHFKKICGKEFNDIVMKGNKLKCFSTICCF